MRQRSNEIELLKSFIYKFIFLEREEKKMALRVDYENAVENVIKPISNCINTMKNEASTISTKIGELDVYWEGSAYNNAMNEYSTNYDTFINTDLPNKLDEFNKYLDDCLKSLKELDEQIGGTAN